MRKKRLINFRSFCLISSFAVLSVLCALVLCNNIYFGDILAITLLGFLSFMIAINRADLVKTLTYALAILVFLLCLCSFLAYKSYWKTPKIDFSKEVIVDGRVQEFVHGDGSFKVIASNLYIENSRVNGKIEFYVIDGIYLDEGDRVCFVATVEPIELVDGYKINSSVAVKGIKYSAQVFSEEIVVQSGKTDWRQKIRKFIRNKLDIMGMSSEVAYSTLTGDENNLSADIYNSYKLSGVAHILAVSGLHVGFFAAIIAFIFNKLRLGRRLNFSLSCILLILYAAFIASSSVYRAVIMTCVGLAAYLLGRKKDTLNTLCLSITVILVLMPFHLFDIGFLLSVSAVVGISLFAQPIERFLKKIKLPFYSGISASVSAQIGIAPCFMYYFGYFQPFSLFFNLLLVPLVAIAYELTILILLLSLILPPLGALLKFPALMFGVVNIVSDLAIKIPNNNLIFFSGGGVIFFFLFYLCCSGYVRSSWTKTVAIVISLTLLLTVNLQNPMEMHGKRYLIPIKDAYNIATLVRGKENYYAGELVAVSKLNEYMREYDITDIDALYLFNISDKDVEKLINIRLIYGNFNVYSPVLPNKESDYAKRLKKYGINLLSPNESGLEVSYRNGELIYYADRSQEILFLARDVDYTLEMERYRFIRCSKSNFAIDSILFVDEFLDYDGYAYGTDYAMDLNLLKVKKSKV